MSVVGPRRDCASTGGGSRRNRGCLQRCIQRDLVRCWNAVAALFPCLGRRKKYHALVNEDTDPGSSSSGSANSVRETQKAADDIGRWIMHIALVSFTVSHFVTQLFTLAIIKLFLNSYCTDFGIGECQRVSTTWGEAGCVRN